MSRGDHLDTFAPPQDYTMNVMTKALNEGVIRTKLHESVLIVFNLEGDSLPRDAPVYHAKVTDPLCPHFQ